MRSGRIDQNGWVICCHECQAWESDARDISKQYFMQLQHKNGWKEIKKNLWICPDCAAGGLPINNL